MELEEWMKKINALRPEEGYVWVKGPENKWFDLVFPQGLINVQKRPHY